MRLLFSISWLAFASFNLIPFAFGSGDPKVAANEVVISCGAMGKELDLCRSGAETWARENGRRVRVLTATSNSGDRLGQYQLLLAAHSSDIDIFVIDTPWSGIIGDFLVDLNEYLPLGPTKDGRGSSPFLADQFPEFLSNNTVRGRLVGLPWFIDAGLLYYRRDLLNRYRRPVPKTWQELTETAALIQEGERKAGRDRMWGYVFQGRAYEGLTCNAVEWIESFGGGNIVAEDGSITLNNPRVVEALKLASSWIGRISPPGVLNYMEEDARGVFQNGNAVFMRNWPYAFKLAQSADSPVRNKVGMAVLPKGDEPSARNAASLGGWSLGISRYSKKKDLAFSLILYLTSKKEQKRRALEGGLSPTWRSLYQDPQVVRSNPSLKELFPVYLAAVPRPAQVVGAEYNRVSTEFYEAVFDTLSNGQAEKNVADLAKKLERLRKRGRWK